MELCVRRGVAANIEYPLPATLIWRLARAVLPDISDRSPFEPATLRWAIAGVLDAVAPSSSVLKGYLDVADARMRHELAGRLAHQIDRYLVFRPDWIKRWSVGQDALSPNSNRRSLEEERWQAELFRVLQRRLGNSDWLSIVERCTGFKARGEMQPTDLPACVHVFGATSLSPAYVDVLASFSEFMDVHFYVLNPCREYWGDLASGRGQPAGDSEREALYFHDGNPLLGSWGKVGRDLVECLQEFSAIEYENYDSIEGRSRLSVFQRDILELRDGRDRAQQTDCVEDTEFQTIQVHVCHSPMREMEVLHDQLLAMFDAMPDLSPSDIVVMAPRIDIYTSSIRAVFNHADPGPNRVKSIPFAIADRPALSSSPVVRSYFDVLEVARGRFGADPVLGLLESACIRRKFGMSDEDIPILTRWVAESGVRWGADASARAEAGAPAEDLHTWQFGLDRLLLGVSMLGERRHLFAGLHPYDGISSSDVSLLGRFIDYIQALLSLAESLRGSVSVGEWCVTLRRVAGDFFDTIGLEENELARLLRTVEELRSNAEAGCFQESVSADVITDELRALLSGAGAAYATDESMMFSGRVTFCELVPMRSIPFRVVCLVGMNGGEYPRSGEPPAFDLVAKHPRRGDRNARDDDCYLFLEATLAARSVLYLSYVGLDQRENNEMPPSPLVSELLDYLASVGTSQSAPIIVRHPLQRFSRAYFASTSSLFSYDDASLRACKALVGEPSKFISLGEIAPSMMQHDTVALDEFIRCLLHPPRYFLEQCLGVRVPRGTEIGNDVEPFHLSGLERYHVRQWLLAGLEPEVDFHRLYDLIRGDGRLPSGPVGGALAQREADAACRHLAALDAWPQTTETLSIDLVVDGLHVRGELKGWNSQEAMLVGQRFARLRARDRLEAVISHLFATAVVGPATTIFVSDSSVLRVPPDDSRREITIGRLTGLVALYREAHTRALPFFPETGWRFTECAVDDLARARRQARAEWAGSQRRGMAAPGESRDPYNLLAFRGADPLNHEFETLSQNLFGYVRARGSESRD